MRTSMTWSASGGPISARASPPMEFCANTPSPCSHWPLPLNVQVPAELAKSLRNIVARGEGVTTTLS